MLLLLCEQKSLVKSYSSFVQEASALLKLREQQPTSHAAAPSAVHLMLYIQFATMSPAVVLTCAYGMLLNREPYTDTRGESACYHTTCCCTLTWPTKMFGTTTGTRPPLAGSTYACSRPSSTLHRAPTTKNVSHDEPFWWTYQGCSASNKR
jgi:hypothetical protein